MANIARMPQGWIDSTSNVSVFDDFTGVSIAAYTITKDAGITAPTVTGLGGLLAITGDATDNDEVYVSTPTIFKAGNGYALECAALLQFSEANTSAANVIFGFASSVGAALMVANGAGPRVTGNVIAIYKVDGGTVWRCVTRWGSTTSVTDTVSTSTAGGSTYQDLRISIADGAASGTCMVTFYLGGSQLKDANGVPIIHNFTNSGASAMSLVVGLKQGSTTPEALNVQKWFASQSY